MVEIMPKDDGSITTGQLRKVLADAMKAVMHNSQCKAGDEIYVDTKSLIALAAQITKTLDLDVKQQTMCLKCKHKLNQGGTP